MPAGSLRLTENIGSPIPVTLALMAARRSSTVVTVVKPGAFGGSDGGGKTGGGAGEGDVALGEGGAIGGAGGGGGDPAFEVNDTVLFWPFPVSPSVPRLHGPAIGVES